MFAALIAGWAFGWRTVSAWVVRRHGWRPALGHFFGCAAGVFSALGLFCLVGAFFDGKAELSTRIVMAVFGLLLLAPFIHFWRKWRAVAGTAPNSTAAPVATSAPQQQAHKSIAHVPNAASATPAATRTQGTTLPCTFTFSYRAQDGSYSPRTVNVTGISSNGGHAYLEGFCLDRMDSRTFRTDRIRGDLTDTETGELLPVAGLLSSVSARASMGYKPPAPAPKNHCAKEWQTSVFFAGFRGGKLDELEGLADAAGWQVRSTISRTVSYVVCNGSAGKNQLAEAENLGISVIDEDTFRLLL